jgi:hypothetical protein
MYKRATVQNSATREVWDAICVHPCIISYSQNAARTMIFKLYLYGFLLFRATDRRLTEREYLLFLIILLAEKQIPFVTYTLTTS